MSAADRAAGLQAVPVADAIMSDSVPVFDTNGNALSGPYLATLRRIVVSSVRVNAQVAVELLNRSGFEKEHDLGNFGPMRLPYPAIWFEWVITDTPRPLRMAMSASEHVGDDGVVSVRYGPIYSLLRGRVTLAMVETELRLDGDGQVSEVLTADYGDLFRPFPTEGLRSQFLVATMAVNLMHCKNVVTEEVKREPARNKPREKKDRRRRQRRVDFHTIVLPGMSNRGGIASSENRDILALHRARGHFKTYTEAAPLFGKLVGTFWWGWQVRGNKANGITVTDYKLADSRALQPPEGSSAPSDLVAG